MARDSVRHDPEAAFYEKLYRFAMTFSSVRLSDGTRKIQFYVPGEQDGSGVEDTEEFQNFTEGLEAATELQIICQTYVMGLYGGEQIAPTAWELNYIQTHKVPLENDFGWDLRPPISFTYPYEPEEEL